MVGALQSSFKMEYFTDVEKAKCVLKFTQNHSATLAQRWFHTNYGKEAPTRKSIYMWHKWFAENGCICAKKKKKKNSGNDKVMRLWGDFVHCFSIVSRNPQGRRAGNWVMSLTWMWRVLRKRPSSWPYKFKLVQERLLYRHAELPWRGKFVFE
jgi:hypothetical protein